MGNSILFHTFRSLFSLECVGELRAFCKVLLQQLTFWDYGFVSSWVADISS